MGRVYEEFTYSVPNLVLLAVALPLARVVQGRWTPFGIGAVVGVSTAVPACVLIGRAHFILDLKLTRFLRAVFLPAVAPCALAGALAWPTARFVAIVGRWRGAVLESLNAAISLATLAILRRELP